MPDADHTHVPLPASTAATALADELEAAAVAVFGTGELSARLQAVARRLDDDCRRLTDRSGQTVPALAVVGRLGEGKSWLAQCFLLPTPENDAARKRLRAGQDAEHRTTRLLWLGPQQPVGLRSDAEDYQFVAADRMLDLGRPYVVGDTPGTSFGEDMPAAPAGIAVHSSSLKVLVLSTHGLRDGGLTKFIGTMNGATILPVVRFRPATPGAVDPPTDTCNDVERQTAEWRRAAPGAVLLDPIYMPESRGDLAGEQALMRGRLQAALLPRLAEVETLRHAVESQLRERTATARREASEVLAEFRRTVGSFASPLDEVHRTLPDEVLRQLLGDETALRVGIRQRLRAEWLDAVPAICFPYRTLVGLLSLTAGAWDRLIIAGLGSLPSLVLTGMQTMRNLRDARDFAQRLRARAVESIERALADRMHDALAQMRRAVAASADGADSVTIAVPATTESPLKLVGFEGLENEVQETLRTAIRRRAASRAVALLCGLLGTLVFWTLFIGPILSLYGGYFLAWRAALDHPETALGAFPTPSAAMLATGLVLSAGPAFLLALVGLSWAARGRRVRRTLAEFRDDVDQPVRRRHTAGELRVVPTDPQLRAVRFLLELRG